MTQQQWISLTVVLLLAAGAAAWAFARTDRSTTNATPAQPPLTNGQVNTNEGALDDEVLSKTCAVSDVEPPEVYEAVREPTFAQEVWVSYTNDEVRNLPGRYPRTRNEALAKIRTLCKRAHRGEDIGTIAREASNATGARALGFTFAPLDPHAITRRDRLYMNTPVDTITPVIEWNGGFGFAKRIDRERGFQLLALEKREARRRARVRVITFAYRGSWPAQEEKRHITREVALGTARAVLRKIISKENTFDELARQYCFDAATRSRGGLLNVRHPKTGKQTEWIHWGTRDIGSDLLNWVLDENTPVGRVHRMPLDLKRGWTLVEVLERE